MTAARGEAASAAAREIDAGTYRVVVAAGLRHEYARYIADAAPAHHYAIVSDVEVAPHYAEPLVLALAAHGPVSLFPRTAVTGAMPDNRSRIPAAPMSPACTMNSLPRRASTASGRSRPCVSEIKPMQR